MSDNEKPDICPTCGSYCRIAGNVTKHYVPFYSDAIKLELDKQNAEIKAQHEEIERLRNLVNNFADSVVRTAFSMRPPNGYTPMFVQLANTARHNVFVESKEKP